MFLFLRYLTPRDATRTVPLFPDTTTFRSDEIGRGADRRAKLRRVRNGHAVNERAIAPPLRAVPAIGLPAPCQPFGAAEQKHQPIAPGDFSRRLEPRPPVGCGEAVVAQHHSGLSLARTSVV